MSAVAASGVSPIDVILALLGGGGVLGALVAFLKLRPDVNTAMVTQAQGAAETMAVLQQQLIADRDTWRARALKCESEIVELRHALAECEGAHGRRRRDPAGPAA